MRFVLICLLSLFVFEKSASAGGSKSPAPVTFKQNFYSISSYTNVAVDLRYATTNNFLSENIYGNFKTPYLHKDTQKQFEKVLAELQKLKPNWKLLIFDALRPHSKQKLLWKKVEGTSEEAYVMNPRYGSIHSYGFALDLSLLDEKGREVDMGTPFDSFLKLSHPRHEEKYLNSGKLTKQQVENRELLRKLMAAGGFKVIPNEWWHFEALPGREVRKKYKIFDQ